MKALVCLHFNRDANTKLTSYKPLDVNNLIIDDPIKKWAPIVQAKLPTIRAQLLQQTAGKYDEVLRIIEDFE
jgi:hypothetical protein